IDRLITPVLFSLITVIRNWVLGQVHRYLKLPAPCVKKPEALTRRIVSGVAGKDLPITADCLKVMVVLPSGGVRYWNWLTDDIQGEGSNPPPVCRYSK